MSRIYAGGVGLGAIPEEGTVCAKNLRKERFSPYKKLKERQCGRRRVSEVGTERVRLEGWAGARSHRAIIHVQQLGF